MGWRETRLKHSQPGPDARRIQAGRGNDDALGDFAGIEDLRSRVIRFGAA
jgi:hypothetical protein